MASEAQDPGSGRRGGLFDAVKILAGTLPAIAHTRLELFSTEIEEQLAWVSSVLVWTFVALSCAAIGFNFVGRRPHIIFSSRGIVGFLHPLSRWLRHRFSPPWVGHCLGHPSWHESCKARASP